MAMQKSVRAANEGLWYTLMRPLEGACPRFELFFYGEGGPNCPLSSDALEELCGWDISITDVV